MKQIALFLLLVFVSSRAFCQTVNGVPIRNIDADYMEIVGSAGQLSRKAYVQLDFGRESRVDARKMIIQDKHGEVIDFVSMIDALNFMTANGYEFVQAYAYSLNGENIFHYLLRKRRQ